VYGPRFSTGSTKIKSRKKSGQRLSREDWLENALTVLSEEGRAGLRIQGLSAALGVSRGSFYWHFKDRQDFIRALLEYWYKEYTAGAPAAVERDGGSAEERLSRLLRLVQDQNLTRHDLTVRSLASMDLQFSKMVKKVDRFRLEFIESLFMGMGFTGDDIKIRARACLAYMTMEHHMFDKLDRKHRSDLVDCLHAVLVRK
jgi:AcrR family transcriptional regulator